MSVANVTYQDILNFWFNEIEPAKWWVKDAAFDNLLVERYGAVHHRATQCELYPWRVAAEGRLAEIIVLDQFSRNMFRDTALAFANDALALALAQESIACGADQSLTAQQRTFLYMPYMHSESAAIHVQAEKLYAANGLQDNYEFELKHKAIIDRFGRYPHRNKILGRASTDAERDFLAQPGSGF